jgi:predicted RNase H-like nuclease
VSQRLVATMAGAPMSAGKATWTGASQRRQALAAVGMILPDDLGIAGLTAGVDDVHDAAAAAWSAQRYQRCEAIRFPSETRRFSDRIDAAIWA